MCTVQPLALLVAENEPAAHDEHTRSVVEVPFVLMKVPGAHVVHVEQVIALAPTL